MLVVGMAAAVMEVGVTEEVSVAAVEAAERAEAMRDVAGSREGLRVAVRGCGGLCEVVATGVEETGVVREEVTAEAEVEEETEGVMVEAEAEAVAAVAGRTSVPRSRGGPGAAVVVGAASERASAWSGRRAPAVAAARRSPCIF